MSSPEETFWGRENAPPTTPPLTLITKDISQVKVAPDGEHRQVRASSEVGRNFGATRAGGGEDREGSVEGVCVCVRVCWEGGGSESHLDAAVLKYRK